MVQEGSSRCVVALSAPHVEMMVAVERTFPHRSKLPLTVWFWACI